MAIHKGLLGVAGGILGALGTEKGLLYSLYSPQCIDAVQKGAELRIELSCPPGFDNFAVITVIGMAVGAIILAYFWQDILREVWNRLFG